MIDRELIDSDNVTAYRFGRKRPNLISRARHAILDQREYTPDIDKVTRQNGLRRIGSASVEAVKMFGDLARATWTAAGVAVIDLMVERHAKKARQQIVTAQSNGDAPFADQFDHPEIGVSAKTVEDELIIQLGSSGEGDTV